MNETLETNGHVAPLSLLEELQEDKRVISAGLAASIEAGKRLLKIRQTRSYLLEADTFEAFCQVNWDFGASRARQICAEARVVASLNLPAGSVTLGNASQVRPLLGLPVAERPAAWEEIKATAPEGGLTRRHVEQIVRKRRTSLGMGGAQSGELGVGLQSVTTGNALAAAAVSGNGTSAPTKTGTDSGLETPDSGLSLSAQAARALTELRALVAMCDTRGSEAAADLLTALARVEKFRAQLTDLENQPATRT